MQQQSASLRAWERVYERLSEFVRVADLAGEAISHGDAPRARVLVHETRAIRAALMRAESEVKSEPIPMTREGIELLANLTEVRQRSRLADGIARAWIERALPDDEALFQLEGGHLAIADRLLPATWDVELDVVALIGPGCAPLAHALTAFGQRRIVVYDPDLGDVDPGLFPDQALLVSARTALSKMSQYSQNPPERLRCYRRTSGLDDSTYSSLSRDVEESFGALILGRNTVTQFGALWLQQGLRNLPRIAELPSIDSVGNRFADVPFVIVAPGPSLSKNVALLKELEGRAIIATFSHTLAALTAAGVKANVVLAVDMEDLRYHFDDYETSEIDALALGVTVHPDLYTLDTRTTFTFAANSAIDHWICSPFSEEMELASGGSVAHSAFSLARHWQCNPIVLVGQDLSFPGGRVYCDSNVDEGTTATVGEDGRTVVLGGWSEGYANLESIGGRRQGATEQAIYIPGVSGDEVLTSATFALFRRWFIDAASNTEKAEASSLRLINCTEGGAFIDGWTHTTLRRFIDEEAAHRTPIDVGKLFADAATFDRSSRQRTMLGHLEYLAESIGATERAANRCISLVRASQRGQAKSLTKIAKAETQLREACRPVAFIALAAQREVAHGRVAARDEQSLRGNLRASRRLYSAIIKVCGEVRPPLRAAIDEIVASLEAGLE